MAAATDNRDPLQGAGDYQGIGVASGSHVYAGTIATIGADGYAIPAAVGATKLVGVFLDEVNNSSTNTDLAAVTAGGLTARVALRGTFEFAGSVTPLQTWVGKYAYPTDDQTVGATTAFGASGGVQMLGRIVGINGSNARVDIHPTQI